MTGAVQIDGVAVLGVDAKALADVRSTGLDHGGNPVEPFVDEDGGWPLRCCLEDSKPGEELAIIAFSPFPWRGAYAEVGPIVVHADDCGGRDGTGLPEAFLERPQIARPYGHDRRILYDLIEVVPPDGSLPDVLGRLLSRDEVDFVLGRNVRAGCYSFTAVRA